MKFIKKNWKKIIIAFLFLIAVSTYFIGSYFVNYALVANSGGEKRPDKKSLTSEEVIKEKRKKFLDEKRDKWLKDVAKNTKNIEVKTNDGLKLYGHTYTQKKDSKNWIILVHGYQSSEKRSQMLAANFYELGYNVLTYSLRGHRPSEGKYIGMGGKDSEDLLKFIDYLIKINPNAKITLHGTSMGAATVLNASGFNLPKNICSIIDDCGYSNLWEIFSKELNLRFNLPSFPVLYMANTMAQIKAGINIKNINPIEQVAKSKVPIMFIHTTGDDFIPKEMTDRMFNIKKNSKEKLIIKGFRHADAVFADKDYFKKIDKFIRENSNK